MATPNDFLRDVYNTAIQMGLPEPAARLAAVQAGLESGFGKHAPGNNYFGIKAPHASSDRTFRATVEYVNGQRVSKSEPFKNYASKEDSLRDWAKQVERNWPGVFTAKTFDEALAALGNGKKGGYATTAAEDYAKVANSVNSRLSRAVADFPTLPDAIGLPPERPMGPGLAALVPNEGYSKIAGYDRSRLDPSLNPVLDALANDPDFNDIGIRSGFRTRAENTAVGGAKNSQHLYGKAVDLDTRNVSPDLLAQVIDKGLMGGARGLGFYPSGAIHLDSRKTPTAWGPKGYGYNAAPVSAFPAYAQPMVAALLGLEQGMPYLPRHPANIPTPTFRENAFDMPVSLEPDRPMPGGGIPSLPPPAPSLPSFATASMDVGFPQQPPAVEGTLSLANASLPGGLGQSIGTLGPAIAQPDPAPLSLPPDRPMPSGPLGGLNITGSATGGFNPGGVINADLLGLPAIPSPVAPPALPAPAVAPVPRETVPPTITVPPVDETPQGSRRPSGRDIGRSALRGAIGGGIPGAVIGGVRTAMNRENPGPGQGFGLGSLFGGPGIFSAPANTYGVGSADAAMFGGRGATYGASNGSTITGLGNGYSQRTSGNYGWTETVAPDGSVIGINYGGNSPFSGGLAGLLGLDRPDAPGKGGGGFLSSLFG